MALRDTIYIDIGSLEPVKQLKQERDDLRAALEKASKDLTCCVEPYIGMSADHVPGFVQHAVCICNELAAALGSERTPLDRLPGMCDAWPRAPGNGLYESHPAEAARALSDRATRSRKRRNAGRKA